MHPFKFTKEGEHFRQSSQEILKDLHRTVDECRQQRRTDQDFVKFAALHTLAINYFAKWVAEIHKDHSPIRTTMEANNFHDCMELLESKQCEFMLSYSSSIIPCLLDPSRFLSSKLKSDQLILVSAVDKQGKPIYRLNSKNPLNYLAYSSNCLMGKLTEQLINNEASGYDIRCVYENAVTESIKAMVVQGMGVGWLPKICIQPELDRGELINIGTKALTISLDIMLYRSTQRLSSESESLWAHIKR